MNNGRIVKKSVLYLIGNMSSKILSSILLPIYAFYITTEELGYYDYSQTIMNIAVPFAFVAIWEAILKFVITENDEEKISKIISTTMTVVILGCVMLFSGIIIIGLFKDNISYLSFIGFMMIAHGLAQIWQYYARALKMNSIYVISGVLSTVINFCSVILLVCILDYGITGLYLGYIFGQTAIVILIEFKCRIISRIDINQIEFGLLCKLVKFSAPLVFNLVSMWFMSGLGRILITNFWGSAANGLYSFANKFSQIVMILGNVIIMAIIEEALLSKNEENFGKKFSKTNENIISLFVGLIILVMPMVTVSYQLISKTAYIESIQYVPILLVYSASLVVASNIGSIFQVVEKTKYQFTTTLVGGIVTTVFSLLTIKYLGIHAVVIGQLIGALTMVFLRYFMGKRFIQFSINWFRILVPLMIYAVISVICLNVTWIVAMICEALILVVFAIIFRKKIMKYSKKIISMIKTR